MISGSLCQFWLRKKLPAITQTSTERAVYAKLITARMSLDFNKHFKPLIFSLAKV